MTKSNPPPTSATSTYQDFVHRLTVTPMTLEELERAAIEATLVANRFNVTTTARVLGLGRTTLYRKMKLYHLRDLAR